MTCTIDQTQFRLLNHLVGWDADVVKGLQGLQQSSGVELQVLRDPDVLVDDSTLSKWLPPARLAVSCDGCDWYLVTPCPPNSRLLVSSSCNRCWTEPLPGAYGVFQCACAVAASPGQVAVSDCGADSIVFLARGGSRQLGRVSFSKPGAIAYANWREWLVVDEQAWVLQRLDMAGVPLGPIPIPLPDKQLGAVDRLAVDDQCNVWIALKQTNGLYTIWRAQAGDSAFAQSHLRELQQAIRPNHLSMVEKDGFCFESNEEHHAEHGCGPCFSWYGRPWSPSTTIASSRQYVEQGQLLTLAIDSGIPRCRWHRVRVDADMPSGTTVSIAVSTSEEQTPAPQGAPDLEWVGFSEGTPHWADWQNAALNSVDFLIQQPPGRYLFLRLRLTGDGFHTPSVRRIRLDFPRKTSLDQLPFVFRENPEAEDFGERFLSLFDAFLEDIDDVIQRLPALFDTNGAPDEILPWLGRFLDVAMDPAWDAERRRRILQAAPKLYRMRGTVDGMRAAIHLVFGVEAVIQESPAQRAWGAVGAVRLNSGARLFGQSNWRFRLGRSRLSQAPLRSFGNPDRDPLNSLAFHFRVLVPLALDATARGRLEQLVEAQKPAHTLVTLRASDSAFVLGKSIYLGIDTAFQPLAPVVLAGGHGGIRLGRSAATLSAARSSSGSGLSLARGAAVGVTSVLS